MPEAVILERIGLVTYREVTPADVYDPPVEEEILHGTRVETRQLGDPGEGEIEVEALAGGICTHEVSLYTGDLTHPRYPMIPGHEAVHRVTRVGRGVTHVKEGDNVSCCWYMGQWSRQVIGPARLAYRLPDAIANPADWLVEPAASIVNAVGFMTLKPGDKALIVGAGFMGLLMTQMISRYPLSEFVVADIKPHNIALARACGARDSVDPSTDAGAARIRAAAPDGFDAVIECSGTQAGLDLAVDACGMAGHVYLFGWHRTPRTVDLKLGHLRGHRLVHTSPATDHGREYERHWPVTIRLIQNGVFNLHPLISHRYPARDAARAMADAARRDDGYVKGALYFERSEGRD